MKRRIVTLLIFLLLGAIVNIAVAWGCISSAGSFAAVISVVLEKSSFAAKWLEETGIKAEPNTQVDQQRCLGLMRQEFRGQPHGYSATDSRGLPVWYRYAGRTEAGLPVAGLTGGFAYTNQGLRSPWALWLSEPWDNPNKEYLPLWPLWPGFAINTLFYAAILWMLFALPGALQRWRRIKRGLCPVCAYPVGTSDLCTECGKPVKPRSVEPAPS